MALRNRQPVYWNGNGTVAVWADEINDAALEELGVWIECSEDEFDTAPLPVKMINDIFHRWIPYMRPLTIDGQTTIQPVKEF